MSINPDDHESWHNRGKALDDLGRKEEAISSYDRALSINPDYDKSWHNRGIALSALGRKEEAISSYDRALSINPDYYKSWRNRGVALANLGKKEEAISSFDRGLFINPDDYALWYDRGYTLSNLGRKEEAISSYDRALSIMPDNYDAYNNKGLALLALGKNEEAISSFDRALTIKPDFYYAYNNKGIVLSVLGKKEEAISFYDQALSIMPNYFQAWLNRSNAAIDSSQIESNIALFLPIGLADRAMGSSSIERALVSCDAGIAYCDSQSTEHIEGRGKLYQRKGDIYFNRGKGARDYQTQYAKAISSYEAALNEWKEEYKYQFGEEYLEILLRLIQIHTTLGNTELAQTLRREGTELYQRLLETSDERSKEKLARRFVSSFRDLTISAYVQSGQMIDALEAAETDKNQCLAWMFADNEIPIMNYGSMQELLDPKTAIIFWHISDYALTTFLLFPNTTVPLGFSAFPINGEPEFET